MELQQYSVESRQLCLSRAGNATELEEKYLENGSFYLLNIKQFLSTGVRHFGNIGVYPMPKSKSSQIDTPEDVLTTEALMEKFRGVDF